MIERLHAVAEEAERLSEVEQGKLITLWEEAIEEAKWEASFANPRSQRALDALVARAKEQVAHGEVYDTPRDSE